MNGTDPRPRPGEGDERAMHLKDMLVGRVEVAPPTRPAAESAHQDTLAAILAELEKIRVLLERQVER